MSNSLLGLIIALLVLILIIVVVFFIIYLVYRSKCDQSALIVDNRNDPMNCGGTAIKCDSPKICNNGNCVCPAGLTECSVDGKCRDLKTDSSNCGGCGLVCPDGYTCIGGICYSYDETNTADPTAPVAPLMISNNSNDPDPSLPVKAKAKAKTKTVQSTTVFYPNVKKVPEQTQPPKKPDVPKPKQLQITREKKPELTTTTNKLNWYHHQQQKKQEQKKEIIRPAALTPEMLCQPPSVWCSTTNECVANFMTDRNNCGDCGKQCAPDEDCVGGQCILRSILASIRIQEQLAKQAPCSNCSQGGAVNPINLLHDN